jgi:membrane protease YdiL (CAAX protease family)
VYQAVPHFKPNPGISRLKETRPPARAAGESKAGDPAPEAFPASGMERGLRRRGNLVRRPESNLSRTAVCLRTGGIRGEKRAPQEDVMNPTETIVQVGGAPETRSGRREKAIEVAVFLFLIGPSLVLSFVPSDSGGIGSFALTAVATILRDLSLIALIFFFFWRNAESVRGLGWTLRHLWRDVLLGIVLFVPMFFGANWLDSLLTGIGFSSPSTQSSSLQPSLTGSEMVLASVLVVVVAIAEETIFRGYLMNRFKAIAGSSLVSLLLSAFVFSLGHGYEGTAGVVTVGAMGLVFGLVFLWRKSLVAPMTMHFLQDFLAIVLLPLLLGG